MAGLYALYDVFAVVGIFEAGVDALFDIFIIYRIDDFVREGENEHLFGLFVGDSPRPEIEELFFVELSRRRAVTRFEVVYIYLELGFARHIGSAVEQNSLGVLVCLRIFSAMLHLYEGVEDTSGSIGEYAFGSLTALRASTYMYEFAHRASSCVFDGV